MTACGRITTWAPGQVPREFFEAASLHLFPGIERLATAHLGRLVIRPSLRGKLVLPSLIAAGYEFMVGERGVDLAFLACMPGLVRYYRRLGARPYGGRLYDLGGNSPGIPLVVVLSDYAHMKRAGSVSAPLVKRYFGAGKRAPLDLAPLEHLFEEAVPVEFDPEKVWSRLQEQLIEGAERPPTFMEALPPDALKRVAASGYLLDMEAGQVITREGIGQREMFVILDGACEVERAGRRFALLEKGDLFGEVAFFNESGERAATVRALGPCRLLVLRQKFLQELTRSDPEAALQILLNVSRILAERLGGMIQSAASASAPEAEA
jgi:CRP-like cAMP-binding protein